MVHLVGFYYKNISYKVIRGPRNPRVKILQINYKNS